jgi:ribosomal protein L19
MVLNSFVYNFSVPAVIASEQYQFRITPSPGDLVAVRYFERMPGRISTFRLHSCYGLCIGRKRSGLTSYFTIRNSFKRNSIEIRFLLYSPLLARIAIYNARRKRYTKAKLYYLRLKKIAKSRFRFEAFIDKV